MRRSRSNLQVRRIFRSLTERLTVGNLIHRFRRWMSFVTTKMFSTQQRQGLTINSSKEGICTRLSTTHSRKHSTTCLKCQIIRTWRFFLSQKRTRRQMGHLCVARLSPRGASGGLWLWSRISKRCRASSSRSGNLLMALISRHRRRRASQNNSTQ